ncbi:hypothetical protein [Burkholderia savannae]|uniref:hypothetical protein n=1 Tax=Burkholderia savannae TaxID=1637837 RepID=UPI0012F4DBC1|nr:hypothetical protein [Burkholderia savannae]
MDASAARRERRRRIDAIRQARNSAAIPHPIAPTLSPIASSGLRSAPGGESVWASREAAWMPPIARARAGGHDRCARVVKMLALRIARLPAARAAHRHVVRRADRRHWGHDPRGKRRNPEERQVLARRCGVDRKEAGLVTELKPSRPARRPDTCSG